MRTRLVSVVGSGGGLDKKQDALAESLGVALARAGLGVVCGGLGGVMESVARGAARGRGDKSHPPIIGILPGYQADACNGFIDIAIPTGMGHARNALVASAGEVVVCVAGAMGALSEVALARKMKRPVVALAASGGTAQLIAQALPSVQIAESVKDAMRLVKSLL